MFFVYFSEPAPTNIVASSLLFSLSASQNRGLSQAPPNSERTHNRHLLFLIRLRHWWVPINHDKCCTREYFDVISGCYWRKSRIDP